MSICCSEPFGGVVVMRIVDYKTDFQYCVLCESFGNDGQLFVVKTSLLMVPVCARFPTLRPYPQEAYTNER